MKQLFKALDMIRRCHPSSFYLRIFYVVVLNVLPLANLFILKYMVDAVTTGENPVFLGVEWSTLSLLGLFCVLFLLNRLVGVCNGVNNDIMSQRLQDYVSDIMQRQSAALARLSLLRV